ncbi:hypothetical protein JCM13304A_14210 [Desulfothermus okinawensis JCM 13304]
MAKVKKILLISLTILMISPVLCFAKMGTGKVSAASKDVDIQIFGSLKTYPMYSKNVDFNDDDTPYDFTLDENGFAGDDDISVRSEFRLGFKGGGENWNFLAILESDLTYDKRNTDRGERSGGLEDIERANGMSGNSFGVEKLEFTYDFSSMGVPTKLETGWQTKFLDLKTGGVLYGDDHPYIGLKGKIAGVSYEILDLFVYDDIGNVGVTDGDALDWNVYTLKLTVPVAGLNFSPFYAYSDNDMMGATVNYFGAEVYGKIGIIVPRAEFVYAVGNKEKLTTPNGKTYTDLDISAYAGFASLELDLSKAFKPYVGGYYMSGDDDANDDNIDAYNPITNISRYAPTFGMENAFIYKYVPILGSHLYANDFAMLGGKETGYGGISGSGSAYNPGMYSLGIGCKGAMDQFSYKTQFQYFWFDETGALEDVYGKKIDDSVGWEFDLQLTYHFNKHFSLGNVFSYFDPDDAVEDLAGDDYDNAAIMDTVEMIWKF